MAEAKRKIEEETKALDSPMFIVEDVQDEPKKQEYLIDEDIEKIELYIAKDALLSSNHVLIQIVHSPKPSMTPSSPTSM